MICVGHATAKMRNRNANNTSRLEDSVNLPHDRKNIVEML